MLTQVEARQMEYTVHVTDRHGNDYCIPGVTDTAFTTLPNGDAGLAFENPYGDDPVFNAGQGTVRHVSTGFTPEGDRCYHPQGPRYDDGHQPSDPYGKPLFEPHGPRTHEAFE